MGKLTKIYTFCNFRNILNDSIVQPFHLYQPFLVVIIQSVQNVSETLNNVFETFMYFDLLNVNVLIKNEITWTLYYYKPYIKSCFSFEVLLIDTFTAENYTNELNASYNDLFPPKKFKFNRCKIKVATLSLPPFVITETLPNGTVGYHGIDVTIVDEICKTLNLIPMYMQSPDGKNRGVLYPNGTATGAMQMVKIKVL